MSKVRHRGYGVNMKMEDKYYVIEVQSNGVMRGTAKVQFYVNPLRTKAVNGKQRNNKQ